MSMYSLLIVEDCYQEFQIEADSPFDAIQQVRTGFDLSPLEDSHRFYEVRTVDQDPYDDPIYTLSNSESYSPKQFHAYMRKAFIAGAKAFMSDNETIRRHQLAALDAAFDRYLKVCEK